MNGKSPLVVIVPKGNLDMASATQMRQRLQERLDAGEAKLVVDLENVGHIDSAGLGELVRALKRAREAGGDLQICGLSRDVRRIFELTRLNKAIVVYATRDEAIASWR